MYYRLIAVSLMLAGAASTAPAAEWDTELATKGSTTYHTYCVLCHGPKMLNRGAQTYNLRKFPLDQPERFADSVKNGKNTMPAWGDRLNDSDIQALWEYMKTRGKL